MMSLFDTYRLIDSDLTIDKILLKDRTCINALFFLYLCKMFMRKILL